MSVVLTIDASDLDDAIVQLKPIFDFEPAPMMEMIAALGESQTRRRITDEKTSPDGAAWPANLEGTSILHRTGRNLLDSVASTSSADEAQWGASWERAHVHQSGATIIPKNAEALVFEIGDETVHAKQVTIPPRPFVGLSGENRQEILDLVTDVLGVGGLQ